MFTLVLLSHTIKQFVVLSLGTSLLNLSNSKYQDCVRAGPEASGTFTTVEVGVNVKDEQSSGIAGFASSASVLIEEGRQIRT